LNRSVFNGFRDEVSAFGVDADFSQKVSNSEISVKIQLSYGLIQNKWLCH